MSSTSHIAVIGAGIVGLSTALWLQRYGQQVTVIDKGLPGMGASFGNAGVFADYACLPFSRRETLHQLPSMLMDKQGPLTIQGRYLPNLLPYGVEYLKACQSRRYESGCSALSQLLQAAPAADDILLATTGTESLITRAGSLAVFDTPSSFEQAQQGQMQERQRHHVNVQYLSADEIKELEPALAPFYAGGVLYPDTYHTVEPVKLCQQYADTFQKNGGILLQASIEKLTPMNEQTLITLEAQGQSWQFDKVVLATGVHSKNLLKTLGVNVPLVSERGYHLELETEKHELTRPVSWNNKSVFLTPMANRIRVAGVAEFAHENAPENKQKSRNLERFSQQMLGRPIKQIGHWIGCRPSTPDSLPIIGPAPNHPNIMLAFGHGHVGLTLGSITGKLVAEQLTGQLETLDIAPFSLSRFY